MSTELQKTLTWRMAHNRSNNTTPKDIADWAVARAAERIRDICANESPMPILTDAIVAAVQIEMGKRLADELDFEFEQLVNRALLKVERS